MTVGTRDFGSSRPVVAQSQAFEQITIKPARSADHGNMRVQVLPDGNFMASAVPVVTLISYAYDVPTNPSPRLCALPDWTVRERYDIEGKAPAKAISPNLPESELRSRIQQMIRRLLADSPRTGHAGQERNDGCLCAHRCNRRTKVPKVGHYRLHLR